MLAYTSVVVGAGAKAVEVLEFSILALEYVGLVVLAVVALDLAVLNFPVLGSALDLAVLDVEELG